MAQARLKNRGNMGQESGWVLSYFLYLPFIVRAFFAHLSSHMQVTPCYPDLDFKAFEKSYCPLF